MKFIENSSTKNGAESDADLDILRLLSNNLLNKSPFTNLADSFNNHNQDLIMIEYLIRAVQDQIRLSEKLSAAFRFQIYSALINCILFTFLNPESRET